MNKPLTDQEIAEAIDEIISGRIVKRSKHPLVWEGENIRPVFIRCLEENNFHLKTVEESLTPVGLRSPGFFIQGLWAYFGWVKWMKYDENIYWKYFGSEMRKASGTSVIIFKSSDPEQIYVNDALQEEHDPDAPPVYE